MLRDFPPGFHKRSDRGRRGVENRHPIFFDDLPPPARSGAVGSALINHLSGAVRKRSVHHIAVAGDPADIGCAPVDVGLGVEVEDILMSKCRLGEIAPRGVQDALWFTGRARGVEDKQGVFCLEGFGLMLVRHGAYFVVPPQVATGDHVDVVPASFDD